MPAHVRSRRPLPGITPWGTRPGCRRLLVVNTSSSPPDETARSLRPSSSSTCCASGGTGSPAGSAGSTSPITSLGGSAGFRPPRSPPPRAPVWSTSPQGRGGTRHWSSLAPAGGCCPESWSQAGRFWDAPCPRCLLKGGRQRGQGASQKRPAWDQLSGQQPPAGAKELQCLVPPRPCGDVDQTGARGGGDLGGLNPAEPPSDVIGDVEPALPAGEPVPPLAQHVELDDGRRDRAVSSGGEDEVLTTKSLLHPGRVPQGVMPGKGRRERT